MVIPAILTIEQYDILDHAAHRAAGGFYCGKSPIESNEK